MKNEKNSANGDLQPDSTLVDRYVTKLKNNKYIASVILIGIAVISVGSFTSAIQNVWSFVYKPISGGQIAIEEVHKLEGGENNKLAFDIVVMNSTEFDKWFDRINISNRLVREYSGAAHSTSRATYRLKLRTSYHGYSNQDSTRRYKAELGGVAKNQNNKWGYRAEGSYTFNKTSQNYEAEVDISFPLAFKVPSSDQSILRIVIDSPEIELDEKHSEGEESAFVLGDVVEEIFRVSIISNNESIHFQRVDDTLLRFVMANLYSSGLGDNRKGSDVDVNITQNDKNNFKSNAVDMFAALSRNIALIENNVDEIEEKSESLKIPIVLEFDGFDFCYLGVTSDDDIIFAGNPSINDVAVQTVIFKIPLSGEKGAIGLISPCGSKYGGPHYVSQCELEECKVITVVGVGPLLYSWCREFKKYAGEKAQVYKFNVN